MKRQKPSRPSRSSRKDEQETGTVPKPKPRQSFTGRYRPAMKTARPKPKSDENTAEDVESDTSQASQESTRSMEDHLLASDSNDSLVVARKAADPYSPPESDDEPLAMAILDSDESSDDQIQVKMPVSQPAGIPEGLKHALMTFYEKEAILRKELNIPKNDKNRITKKTTLKAIPGTSNGNIKEEPLKEVVPDVPQMQQDEKKEQALQDTGKDIVDKTVIETVKAEEPPNQGPKFDEPNKDKEAQELKEEQEPKGELNKSGNEEKKDKVMENVEKQEKNTEAVVGKDPNEKAATDPEDPKQEDPKQGHNQKDKEPKQDEPKREHEEIYEKKSFDEPKTGLKQNTKPKCEETSVGSDDNSSTKPPIAKRPKEGDHD